MTPKEFVKAYEKYGSVKAVARAYNMTWRQTRKAYLKAVEEGLCDPQPVGRKSRETQKKPEPKVDGTLYSRPTVELEVPPPGEVRRHVFTCAQNNTRLHTEVWDNLLALAEHLGAELHVARYTYIKSGLGARGDKAKWVKKEDAIGRGVVDLWWDNVLDPYLLDTRVRVAPGLVFCGEINILPTAARPLSGLLGYTGRASGIFPHVKLAMESVPSGKHEATKLCYTTGAVTQRNYIQKKTGLKGEFHHCFHGETEFITDKGLAKLGESVGKPTKVWSGNAWEDADIRSFGNQLLDEVTFAPAVEQSFKGTKVHRFQKTDLTRTIKVTSDHTWHLADGSITRSLKNGDVVPATSAQPNSGHDFEEGVRHGLIFGDGSITYRSIKTGLFSHHVCLHGDAAASWIHLFNNLKRWNSREKFANYHGTGYHKSKVNMKELPPDGSCAAYIGGFIIGWIAADGHVNKRDGCTQLCSVTKYALEWAINVAPYAGYVATGFCKGSGDFTSFGKLRNPLWRLTLSKAPRFWKVKKIERSVEDAEVFCAIVQPSHKFTLAGGVLTGNCYGGLLVEVDSDGNWWCRQLNADSSGTIYDLDVRVQDGEISTGHNVEAIQWGDIHVADLDMGIAGLCWGEGAMLDTLRPRFQFLHDVLDFRGRSHHDTKDPHRNFLKHVNQIEDVRAEVEKVGRFLDASSRPWCRSVVVDSNHHNHLGRWLREQDGRQDPVNAEYWLRCNSAAYSSIRKEGLPNYLRIGLSVAGWSNRRIQLLEEDESFLICPSASGGIECGHHGHAGPNGSRGTTSNLSLMGRKINKGHDHKATIFNGVYSAGVCCSLTPYWTNGPSSWTHSHIITYKNGKRAIVTMWNGKWRA